MGSIYRKELSAFFSSLVGYLAIGVFLVLLGLVLFVFEDTSLLTYNYATLDQLFEIAPWVFLFLIPAITMRSLAEERQQRTMELLLTYPLTPTQIVLGKFFACVTIAALAILPTLLYYYTVYQLAVPVGNIDGGAVAGSYIGLLFLAASFCAIGLFASTLTDNQIVGFLLGTFLCFFFYYGFDFLSRLPVFVGRSDDLIQMFGIDYHYTSISRGVLDTRDLVYFLSVVGLFLAGTVVSLERRKW